MTKSSYGGTFLFCVESHVSWILFYLIVKLQHKLDVAGDLEQAWVPAACMYYADKTDSHV